MSESQPAPSLHTRLPNSGVSQSDGRKAPVICALSSGPREDHPPESVTVTAKMMGFQNQQHAGNKCDAPCS